MIARRMRACPACRMAPGGFDRPCSGCKGRGEIPVTTDAGAFDAEDDFEMVAREAELELAAA